MTTGRVRGDTNLLGYTGALTDPTTNDLYLSHRYYAPTQGSFNQQDTITKLTDPTNGNLYTYAGDNPTNYIDPTGRDFGSTVATYVGEGAGVGTVVGCTAGGISTGITAGFTLGPEAAPFGAAAGCLTSAPSGATAGGVIGGFVGVGVSIYDSF